MAGMVDDVAQADDAGVRHAEQIGRHLRARQKEAFEAGDLGDAGIDRAEAARHRRQLRAHFCDIARAQSDFRFRGQFGH
jgi:hypothetical protein